MLKSTWKAVKNHIKRGRIKTGASGVRHLEIGYGHSTLVAPDGVPATS